MTEKMSREKAEWSPEWLTIREFIHITPVNLFHKEQEEGEKQPEAEQQLTAEFRRNLHVLVRARFTLETAQENLTLRLTADDHYKLYVESGFVAEGPAPGYPDHYYYNEIPLGKMEAGEHCFGLHLYYQGLINRVYNSGDLRFAFAAELMDAQGCRIPLRFCYERTDAYSGGTIGYDTQFLENFDSRKFPEGWSSAEFEDAGWKTPAAAEWADYRLYLQPTRMLCGERIKPEKVEIYEDGSIRIDVGEEVAGSLCLTAEGSAGDTVEIFCGEELDESGSVRCEMRCNCSYHEIWTLSDGCCSLEPYDYKGFRYAKLLPGKSVNIRGIFVQTRHYPMEEGAEVTSSEKRLGQIFSICKNAVKYGTQEGYVDCPTREKGQYLGDAVVTAHAQVLLTGETQMLLKCIDQFAQTRAVCPGLLAVAPGGLMQEIADYSLMYPQLLALYYRYTGDAAALLPYYETALGMIRHFAQYERADGLLMQVADKWNLVDWPENLRDDYDFALTRPVVGAGCHNVINALYLGAKKTLNGLARVLGREEPYELEKPVFAYRRAFYRKETGLLADSETSSHTSLHSNVYALYFGLLEEAEEAPVIEFLEKRGFSCGVMLSYYLLLALARRGRYESVYRLLLNDSDHGWCNMLREGATTCFEAWGKDQKWNTSLCHPWASAPVPVILEEIAGIHLSPEGGCDFAPHIPKEVDYFHTSVRMRGKTYTVTKQDGEIHAAIDGIEQPKADAK